MHTTIFLYQSRYRLNNVLLVQSIFNRVWFRQTIWLKMVRINYNYAIENSSFEAHLSDYCL